MIVYGVFTGGGEDDGGERLLAVFSTQEVAAAFVTINEYGDVRPLAVLDAVPENWMLYQIHQWVPRYPEAKPYTVSRREERVWSYEGARRRETTTTVKPGEGPHWAKYVGVGVTGEDRAEVDRRFRTAVARARKKYRMPWPEETKG